MVIHLVQQSGEPPRYTTRFRERQKKNVELFLAYRGAEEIPNTTIINISILNEVVGC